MAGLCLSLYKQSSINLCCIGLVSPTAVQSPTDVTHQIKKCCLKKSICKTIISKMVHLKSFVCFCHAAFQRKSKSTVNPPEAFRLEVAEVDDLHLNMDSKEQMLL